MEMHQVRYFLAMADVLNFTRAAEKCNVSQPALTRAIQKLEEEMGGPLFRREGRYTHLTELGRLIRPRLEQVLFQSKLAREEAGDFSKMLNAGLDLGCMCTIAPTSVMNLIELFNCSTAQLKLSIHQAPGASLVKRLLEGEIDVALLALPGLPDNLTSVPLFQENYVVAFPAGHRFADMDCVPVTELAGEVYLKRTNCEYPDMFQAAGHSFDCETVNRFQSEHEPWIQAMVIGGLGCTIMPESLAQHPKLLSRPLVKPAITRTVSVVTRRGRSHTPVVNCLVNLSRRVNWGLDPGSVANF
ncbi:LysR family transcriptional regulator [Ruegeria atlantica]|uniref:LysR family transcriptional regulator n=1 Tax=Ruegeria atlantica TaxID=81569 RepID=UPI0014815814|nr:LysR family transcriptional regulator [Ruegeria atlantica]